MVSSLLNLSRTASTLPYENKSLPRNPASGPNPFSLINQDRMSDEFIKIASIGSPAAEIPKEFPSSEGQKKLALLLKKKLESIGGLVDVKIDDKHYVVTATLPHNLGNGIGKKPVIGLLAHYDTNFSVPNELVNPVIHKNYQKGDLPLPKDGTVIKEKELAPYRGEDIISSDGSTLLGADDKAGIAEIMELMKIYSENPNIKHPTIKVAFTPDEENGGFSKHFDIKGFGADLAYTVDGGRFDTFDTDTIGIDKFTIEFIGFSTHTGFGKNKMLNGVRMASDFVKTLPMSESPERTDGWKGFYHVDSIQGDIGKVTLRGQLRDFNYEKNQKRVQNIYKWAQKIEKKYPGSRVNVTVEHAMKNLRDKVSQYPEIMENAKEGIERTIRQTGSNRKVKTEPVRGGTDGAVLTERGLPAPNLPAGEENFHSKNEFISIQEMVRATANLFNIMSVWAEKVLNRQNNN